MAWRQATADNEALRSALGEDHHERFFLSQLLEHLPDQIYFKDRESKFILCSESCARRLGLRSAAEAIGKSDYDFFSPEFAKLGYDTEQDMMAKNESLVDIEREEVHSDGHSTWAAVTKMPLIAPNGEVIGMFGLNRDISLRKQAELALRAANERLATVVQIQREIAQTELDMDSVRSIIVERTRSLGEADGAAIMLVENDELVSAAGSGWGLKEVGTRVKATGKGAFKAALDTKRSQQVQADEGVGTLGKDLDGLFEREVRSLLVVPLEHDQKVVGLLCVTRCDTKSFDEAVADSLELLSIVLSAALSNAAEFEQRKQRIEMLAQFEAIYSRAPIGIATIDAKLKISEPNPALCELLDHPFDKLEGAQVHTFISKDDRAREKRYLQSLLRGARDFYSSDARFERADGVTIWAHVTVSLVRDAEDGSPHFAIMMIENVTERRLAEEAAREQAALNEYQALHDGLTGLPNRTLFHDRIQHALLTSEREGGRMAVLMMDLDRFKEVNDTLGHAAGDVLLKELAVRLGGALRATDTVARLGGDEFGLLFPGNIDPHDIEVLLEKIRKALEPPVQVGDLPLSLEASIGVALYPDDGTDVESLLRHADVAMYLAKEEGKDYAFYEPAADTSNPNRLTLVSELRQAIDKEQLILHYQPKVTLDKAAVRGVEALIRWDHPQRGLVPPDEFIPIAQETGLIKPLTRYVIDHALEQVTRWREEGLEIAVSVNLATRNLIDAGFPEEVQSLLEKWNVEPRLLELELTESTMLEDPFRTKVVLERLHEMGVRISIDDFGTGYSSLAYLKELPVSEIKIDRSFVINMHRNDDDCVIVQSTIDLGRNLGLDVVAEGVETKDAWDKLKDMGCSLAQGYFLSRPMPPEMLYDWLSREEEAEAAAAARTSGAGSAA